MQPNSSNAFFKASQERADKAYEAATAWVRGDRASAGPPAADDAVAWFGQVAAIAQELSDNLSLLVDVREVDTGHTAFRGQHFHAFMRYDVLSRALVLLGLNENGCSWATVLDECDHESLLPAGEPAVGRTLQEGAARCRKAISDLLDAFAAGAKRVTVCEDLSNVLIALCGVVVAGEIALRATPPPWRLNQ